MAFADETKCYCQLDLFGTECSFYQLNPQTDMLSDAQRIKYIARLKMEKSLNRVLMSHDIHTKHRLVRTFSFLNLFLNICIYIYII